MLGNGQFLLCTAKIVEGKIAQEELCGKNRASDFCSPSPVCKELN